jgi:hypothetical protein
MTHKNTKDTKRRKSRNMGPPGKTAKKARSHTPTAVSPQKPPSPLESATLFDIALLLREPPGEEPIVQFIHNIPHPGAPQGCEWKTRMNTATKETRHFERKRGTKRWYSIDIAERRRKLARTPN